MSVFTILGTRGTMPASGPEFVQYGGHTSSFSLPTPAGLLIFDAGTGLQTLAAAHSWPASLPIAFFFTHFHLDHIMGLPAFAPLYERHARVRFFGPAADETSLRGILSRFMSAPYWPVDLREIGADATFTPLSAANGSRMIFGVEVSWHPAAHSSPCLAYRIAWENHSIVLAVDREQGRAPDARFTFFCRDADTLIHDAHFTEEEYPAHRGWGHSTWRDAAVAAKEANARKLILTHHAPQRTDTMLETILEKTRKLFPNTELAAPGLTLQPGA